MSVQIVIFCVFVFTELFPTHTHAHTQAPCVAASCCHLSAWSTVNFLLLCLCAGLLSWFFCLGVFFLFVLVHNNRVVASPAVGGGKVFVGSDDSKLYCFDQNSGKVLWTFKTGAAVRSSPALAADGSVVFGSYDGSAYRVSGTGKQIWKTSIGGQVCLCCLCNCIALLLFEVGAGVVKRQQWSFMPKCACFCVNPATSSRSRCCCCCCCCRW